MGLREATKRGRSTPGAGAGSWVNLRYLSDAPVLLGLRLFPLRNFTPDDADAAARTDELLGEGKESSGKGGGQQASKHGPLHRGIVDSTGVFLLHCCAREPRRARAETQLTRRPSRGEPGGGGQGGGGNEPRGGPRLAGVRCKPTEEDHQDHIGPRVAASSLCAEQVLCR